MAASSGAASRRNESEDETEMKARKSVINKRK
jgi:hypothetical protein